MYFTSYFFSHTNKGASSGIGEGTAIHFANLGAKLFVTGRNEDNLNQTIQKCTQLGLPRDSVSFNGYIISQNKISSKHE